MLKDLAFGILLLVGIVVVYKFGYTNIAFSLVFVALGLALLILSGDKLVDGSSSIALRYKIPPIVVGLTVVSFGTSAPELVVSLISAINKNADISIANVVGSNIVNLLFILGFSALLYPILVNKSTLHYELPFNLIITAVFAIAVNDKIFSGFDKDILSRGDGLILLCLFAIFMYYIFKLIKTGNIEDTNEQMHILPTYLSIIYIITGILGLYIGGRIVVEGSVFIATKAGISQLLIGATIVAIGTSLPELTASVIAAMKKHSDLAIGNVVGSNIFNILWILGLSSSIVNINFNSKMNFDILVLLISTFALLIFLAFSKKPYITRYFGLFFVIIYVFYTIFIIYRG